MQPAEIESYSDTTVLKFQKLVSCSHEAVLKGCINCSLIISLVSIFETGNEDDFKISSCFVTIQHAVNILHHPSPLVLEM